MSATKGVFRGDHELMTDMLIAACMKKPSGAEGYTGFGRELTPYFGHSEPVLEDVPSAKGKSSGTSPARSPAKQTKRKASPQQDAQQRPSSAAPVGQNVKPQSRTSSGRESGARGGRRGNATITPSVLSHAVKEAMSAPVNIPKHSIVSTVKNASPARSVSPSGAFACPAFFNSPQPSALPMPGLLLRAAATVAA